MKLELNEIDSGKEISKSRNYETLFGNGRAKPLSAPHALRKADAELHPKIAYIPMREQDACDLLFFLLEWSCMRMRIKF